MKKKRIYFKKTEAVIFFPFKFVLLCGEYIMSYQICSVIFHDSVFFF